MSQNNYLTMRSRKTTENKRDKIKNNDNLKAYLGRTHENNIHLHHKKVEWFETVRRLTQSTHRSTHGSTHRSTHRVQIY